MLKKDQKQELVEKLGTDLSQAKLAALVDFTGLTVKLQQDLKRQLKTVGARMIVVKNTLLKLAITKAKIASGFPADTALRGQTALVISREDPISPLQILGKFAKDLELPKFKVGLVEGSLYDAARLTKLAYLPSKEVLAGEVVGAMASPMYGLVGTLQGNLQKLIYILKTKGGGK